MSKPEVYWQASYVKKMKESIQPWLAMDEERVPNELYWRYIYIVRCGDSRLTSCVELMFKQKNTHLGLTFLFF